MASRYDTIPQFNPFVQPAPLDLVSQTGMMKEGKYLEGLQKVQSYVDKASSIDLIKDADRQYYQQKLGDLNNNLRDLASQDFSNPQVQSTVGGLANSIFMDKNIQNGYLGSQKVRQKQQMISDIRTKTPELYNANNEAYSMMDISAWLNDGTAGTPLVDNKAYSNYYDYSKEVRDAMKDFKPSKIRRKTPQGEWLVTTEDSSYTDAEVREYLNGVLSDRAKNQLKIEGVVSFAGRDDALLSSYYQKMKDNVTSNSKAISALNARSTSIADPAQKSLIQDKINSLKEQSIDYTNKTDSIDKGDTSFFNANKEGIAAWLMKDGYINGVVAGYSHVDDTVEYSPNEIWKAKFQESMANARQSAKMAFDARESALDRQEQQANRAQTKQLKLLELGLTDEEGNPVPKYQKTQYNATTKDLQESGRDKFDNEVRSVTSSNTDAYIKLRDEILAGDENLKRQNIEYIKKGGKSNTKDDPVAIATSEFLHQQLSKPASQRNPIANDYIEKVQALNMDKAVYDQKKSNIDNQVAINYGKDIVDIKNKIAGISSIDIPVIERQTQQVRGETRTTGYSVTGKQTISAQDILDYMGNTGSPKKGAAISQILALTGVGSGAQIDATTKAQGDAVRSYIKKIDDVIGNKHPYGGPGSVITRLSDARKYENSLYDQTMLDMGDWYTPISDKQPEVQAALTFMKNNYGGDIDEYSIGKVNRTTGEVMFKLNPKKASTINTTLLKGAAEYNEANDGYTYKGLPYFVNKGLSNLSTVDRSMVKALDVNVNIPAQGYYTPSGSWDPSGNHQQMQILKRKGADGNFQYFLRHEDSKVIINQNLVDPISAINAAKVLTSDLGMLQDIIRKQEPNYSVKQ